jgi:hypothetical protein
LGIETITILIVVTMIALMLLGVPLAWITMTLAVGCTILWFGPSGLPLVASRVFGFVSEYVFVAVPLFVNRRWNGTPDRRAIGTPLAGPDGCSSTERAVPGVHREGPAPGASAPRARWRADGAGGACGAPGVGPRWAERRA